MRALVVGDVHATPEELEDCQALVGLVASTATEHGVDTVIWMGDQHNSHDTMSTRVLSFWRETFWRLHGLHIGNVALVGNHDQANPVDQFPHAMLAYKDMPNVEIADSPRSVGAGVCAMPFYHDPIAFLTAAEKLKAACPEAHTLLCHQTFVGADEGAFYAKEGVTPAAVPFKTVLSGHIHSPQVIDKKVIYVGGPRWRTRDDAGQDRFIYVIDFSPERMKLVTKVSTGSVCRRIWCLEDRPDAPADLGAIDTAKDLVHVDVHGPAAHVAARETALEALGARPRGFPDRVKHTEISETEGIDKALGRYFEGFKPPFGTPKGTLLHMLEERLG